jgi:hypothetical protein
MAAAIAVIAPPPAPRLLPLVARASTPTALDLPRPRSNSDAATQAPKASFQIVLYDLFMIPPHVCHEIQERKMRDRKLRHGLSSIQASLVTPMSLGKNRLETRIRWQYASYSYLGSLSSWSKTHLLS